MWFFCPIFPVAFSNFRLCVQKNIRCDNRWTTQISTAQARRDRRQQTCITHHANVTCNNSVLIRINAIYETLSCWHNPPWGHNGSPTPVIPGLPLVVHCHLPWPRPLFSIRATNNSCSRYFSAAFDAPYLNQMSVHYQFVSPLQNLNL